VDRLHILATTRVALYGLLLSSALWSQSAKPTLAPASKGRSLGLAERSNAGVLGFQNRPGEEEYNRAVGFYLERSYLEAAAAYQIACNKLNAKACTDLGVMYRLGQGVKRNYPRAAELLQLGCDGGSGLGCSNLGLMYWNNFMPKDDKHAADLFRRGCDTGDRDGCRVMGFMYEKGLGVAKDSERAARFYQKAHEYRIPFIVEDGLILIETTLNGGPVKLIVDTGGTTALGAKFLPSTSPSEPATEMLESLHGRSAVYPTSVEWSFDGITEKVSAVVGDLTFPDGTDGILGADILERFKSARFDFHNSVLILEHE
jgi:hypothetical protein